MNFPLVRDITSKNAHGTNMPWTFQDVAACNYDCNVVHINTHGNDWDFVSDTNDVWVTGDYDINRKPIYGTYGLIFTDPTVDYVKPFRVAAHGSGQVPFNSGSPPMNLVLLDACGSGTYNSFAEAYLYPYGNYFNPAYSWECQAECGYVESFVGKCASATSEAFWQALQAGYTAHFARVKAYDAYINTGFDSGAPENAYDFMHVYGDWFTRLKGVYTANPAMLESAQSDWWRDGL